MKNRYKPFPVDVDNTLVVWDTPTHLRTVKFKCPYTGDNLSCEPHLPHIRLLKEKFARGYLVIVWSQSGQAHAQTVVKALGLTKYVNLILDKPYCYLDDVPAEQWMGERLWLDPKMNYKNRCK